MFIFYFFDASGTFSILRFYFITIHHRVKLKKKETVSYAISLITIHLLAEDIESFHDFGFANIILSSVVYDHT